MRIMQYLGWISQYRVSLLILDLPKLRSLLLKNRFSKFQTFLEYDEENVREHTIVKLQTIIKNGQEPIDEIGLRGTDHNLTGRLEQLQDKIRRKLKYQSTSD